MKNWDGRRADKTILESLRGVWRSRCECGVVVCHEDGEMFFIRAWVSSPSWYSRSFILMRVWTLCVWSCGFFLFCFCGCTFACVSLSRFLFAFLPLLPVRPETRPPRPVFVCE